ncbi:MAG: M3 family metallopeptidase [Bacteroidales bacterium]|nr:M3 family metallopeptidase [Bacteroidales bacterium]
MKKTVSTIACLAALAAVTTMCTSEKKQDNALLSEYTTEYQIPPFSQIRYADYLPAMQAGIDEQNANIQAIIDNPEAPTFENTIVPLEASSPTLDRVTMVMGALTESDACPELDSISDIFMPAITRQSDEVMMNDGLFQRIKAIHDNPEGLAPDQKRLVEKYYKNFTAAGALLSPEQKEELKAINGQLADLYLKFNKNLLSATNEFQIVVDDASRLAGLPQSSVAQAADAAKERGLDGKYVFTLHAPSRLPLLQYAKDRDLRRQMYEGYTSLASSGQYSNYPVINDILKARAKKAQLLGYDNFGSMMTDKVMAKTVDNAENLLMQIWEPAKKRVAQEVKEMQAIANKEGAGIKIEPWDYYYYAEKVRQNKYDLDEAAVREYFPIDSVRNGIFTMANSLYGINFTPMPNAPKYNPEVDVYNVTDAQTGDHIAVFMTDYFPRPSKRQGAWMFEFKGTWENPDGTSSRPIVYNVGNLTKPSGDTPALLTLDEVETMFHEFGHALQGMLTTARYKSLAGTNVDRDYVELCSQIHEHWAFDPDFVGQYAHHYQTGEPIPADLVKKLEASSTHNQGFTTAELVGAALLDLQYGKLNPDSDIDVAAFEQKVAKDLGMPKELTYRYRSPYFKHSFGSDEYASGYYTYLWAEVLDADGFELFKEKGIFDPETAKSFKENILEPGDNEDPMVLYTRFRGQAPTVDALLRNRGLK